MMVTVIGNGQVQILYGAVCIISQSANTFGNGINPIILPLAIVK